MRLDRWPLKRPYLSLLYHLCSDRRLPHLAHLYPYKTIAAFECDLAHLREHFAPVGHDEILAHFEGSRRLPPHAVEVTFDDGLAECFSLVRPLLLEYEIPATFFVVTNLIDNRDLMFRHKISLCLERLTKMPAPAAAELARVLDSHGPAATPRPLEERIAGLEYGDERIDALCQTLEIDVSSVLANDRPYLTGDEIRQLHVDGFTIGAHTCNHPRLEKLADWRQARSEIVDSCAAVRALTGQERVPFAIPFNGLRIDRERLAALFESERALTLIYDTNGLMKDRPRVVNRIWADDPKGSREDRSNLPLLLGKAYLAEPWRKLMRWKRLRS